MVRHDPHASDGEQAEPRLPEVSATKLRPREWPCAAIAADEEPLGSQDGALIDRLANELARVTRQGRGGVTSPVVGAGNGSADGAGGDADALNVPGIAPTTDPNATRAACRALEAHGDPANGGGERPGSPPSEQRETAEIADALSARPARGDVDVGFDYPNGELAHPAAGSQVVTAVGMHLFYGTTPTLSMSSSRFLTLVERSGLWNMKAPWPPPIDTPVPSS